MIIYLAAIDAPEDRDTFVALYETYRNLMFHVAHQILRNEADAEDAVHDAFVTVAEKISLFSSLERHKTRSLLVTIVEHKAIDLYRKKQRRGEAPLVEEISGIDPGPQEDASPLAQCILRLPGRYREFFRLKYELGYSTREAGQLMGLSCKEYTNEQCLEMAKEALDLVRLKESDYNKYAHQLSAGQQQRVGIARAISAHPKFIVLDEPTSSLDVSIRAEIIDLLVHLQKNMDVSYLFISHDLSTIQYICHRVAVMYLGSIVEYGTVEHLFKNYSHPYSKALLASVMVPDPDIKRSNYKLTGEIPSAINLPKGCALASRCKEAEPRCFESNPQMVEIEKGHFVKCFHAKGCPCQSI